MPTDDERQVTAEKGTPVERIAKIERTHLGWEDHGIFTAMLHVTYGGSGQGIGGYVLDEPRNPSVGGDGHRSRRGTAFGMEWVLRAMRACGVDTWEQVKGRTILVYMEDDGWNAKPVGIGPLPTEKGDRFMFADLDASGSRDGGT